MSGSTVESGLALFAGKKVLLVEFCDMVRASTSVQQVVEVHVILSWFLASYTSQLRALSVGQTQIMMTITT